MPKVNVSLRSIFYKMIEFLNFRHFRSFYNFRSFAVEGTSVFFDCYEGGVAGSSYLLFGTVGTNRDLMALDRRRISSRII